MSSCEQLFRNCTRESSRDRDENHWQGRPLPFLLSDQSEQPWMVMSGFRCWRLCNHRHRLQTQPSLLWSTRILTHLNNNSMQESITQSDSSFRNTSGSTHFGIQMRLRQMFNFLGFLKQVDKQLHWKLLTTFVAYQWFSNLVIMLGLNTNTKQRDTPKLSKSM